eukprot:RCo034788
MSRLFGNLRRSGGHGTSSVVVGVSSGTPSSGSTSPTLGSRPSPGGSLLVESATSGTGHRNISFERPQNEMRSQLTSSTTPSGGSPSSSGFSGGGPSSGQSQEAQQPDKPKTQRYRGVSFKKEYTQPAKSHFGAARKRAPSMIHAPTKHMLPPKRKEDKNKLTIVLDLDETLIYAREGPLYARPHIDKFLAFLGQHFETVVWTAGVRAYAQAVIRNIDPEGVITHCIYRHERWFTGQPGYSKDLSLVGRNLSECLILENTPDCVRGYEDNGILVADYEGGEEEDPTLLCILQVLELLVASGKSVPEFLPQCRLLSRQYVATDLGDQLYVYCLNTQAAVKAEEMRNNRDLKPLAPSQY